MARIFISYKRADKDKVFPIVGEIKQKTGVDCWIDLEGIESGDQFQNVIIDAIDNVDIVVFMLSRNFIAPYKDAKTGKIDLKKQTFPEKEVMYALNEGKRLIPLSIDGTTVNDCKWLKFNCSGLDCVDWENDEQRNKFLRNVKKWCCPPPMEHSKTLATPKNIKIKLISFNHFNSFEKKLLSIIQDNCGIGEMDARHLIENVPVELPVSFSENEAAALAQKLMSCGCVVDFIDKSVEAKERLKVITSFITPFLISPLLSKTMNIDAETMRKILKRKRK